MGCHGHSDAALSVAVCLTPARAPGARMVGFGLVRIGSELIGSDRNSSEHLGSVHWCTSMYVQKY